MAESNVRGRWQDTPDVWKKAVYKLKDLVVHFGELEGIVQAREAWACAVRFARQDREKAGLHPIQPVPPAEPEPVSADQEVIRGEMEAPPF